MNETAEESSALDDDSHPIPCVSSLDVMVKLKNGGAVLGLVIAKPMPFDETSQRRLLRKLDNYLGFINSDEFEEENCRPCPEKVKIAISIHDKSDPLVFDFIEKCKPWAADNNTELGLDGELMGTRN